jgi:hypothetical protein
MRNNTIYALCFTALCQSCFFTVWAQGRTDTTTAGQLLQADNRSERSHLEQLLLVQRSKEPAHVVVNAVYGLADDLRVDVTYEGVKTARVTVGDVIGGSQCRIEKIQNRCVTLSYIKPESKKKSTETTGQPMRKPALACPATCWTGRQLLPAAAFDLSAARMPSGVPITGAPISINSPMPAANPSPPIRSQTMPSALAAESAR